MTEQLEVAHPEIGKSSGYRFGQREPLTVRLHGLIRNYPKGVGIFQEFIQNADDAGASWVKIILDRRTFLDDHLPSSAMAKLMGPALMIYNDQVFLEDDLESIQKIGMGSKSQIPSKTGRFGLGFNACYNVTDYPSFLTGRSIYFFDPHCNTVEGADVDAPGQAWDLTPEVWKDFHGILLPFEILGLEKDMSSFQGTIFRLPLRNAEQAQQSQISHEPFLETDFYQLLSQFTPLGADMLIFLKHVIRITVYETTNDSNHLIELLDITTINEEEVRENRDQVNNYVHDDPAEMIHILKNRRAKLPVVSFTHHIKLQTPEFVENQTWRVVSGLFVDDQRAIVDLVERMYKNEEKAIPWAGAAARLNLKRSGTETDIISEFQGKVFCFLPLHIQTRLPVHINGFFDLDSSRQTLTTDHQTLSGKGAIRAEWNAQLVNQCVGRAYAILITDLVDVIGRSKPKVFYKYWPDSRRDLPEGLKGLSTAVYKHLQTACVLHSADPENEWCSIESLFIIPDEWQTQLQSPLAADGMSIPKPELPRYIPQGYKAAGIEYKTITPGLIRSHLCIYEDIDKPIAEVERPCLRQRKWIIALLKYCLSDEPASDLVGVPLAILSDGHLHTFGLFKANAAFLATEVERKIFSKFKNWFIERKFAKECDLSPISEAKLFQLDPGRVIRNLNRILNFPDANNSTEWNPHNTHAPNNNWLCLVYEYISSKIDDVSQNDKAVLDELHMAPDQFNRLWKLHLACTPLFPPDDLSEELRSALNKLEIPILSGSKELVSAISSFQKKTPGRFIWGFTGRDFVDTLSVFADKWQTQYSSYDSEIHDPLLDFLSLPKVIDDLKQFGDRITKLKELLIYPTVDGRLVRASDPELYLPAKYDPPTGGSTLNLLSTGPDGRWIPLLRLLEIEELDRPTLIQKILLPGYANLTPSEQVQILEWIRDNLSLAETEQRKKTVVGAHKTADIIGNAALILCSDGNYHACRTIYDPRQEQPIRAVLGADALFPDMEVYKDQERWLKFFYEDLGMASSPRAEAILQAADKLIEESTEKGVLSVSERLVSIFKYIVTTENWNKLSKESVGDADPGNSPTLFIDLLREKKWLPAQRNAKQLTRYAAFQLPEDRLYQPGELYIGRLGHLVASQMPLATIGQPEKEVARALGFPESPSFGLVIKHFDAILNKWSQDNHGGLEEETLTQSLGEIYRYFGNLKVQTNLDELKIHYAEVECLWHSQKNKFFRPNHVFKESVQYMDPWRTQIEIKETQQDQGYTNLGRIDEPGVTEFIEFLEDMQMEFLEEPLLENISHQVIQVLRLLSSALMDDKVELVFPVLTQKNKLVNHSNVYVSDAPWLIDKISEGIIHLLHVEVPSDLIRSVGIPLLSKNIKEKLAFPPEPSDNQKLIAQCDRLQSLIRSKEFRSGLVRLIKSEHGYVIPGDLNWLGRTNVHAVEAISVDLWMKKDTMEEKKVGSGAMIYFFDPDLFTIFLASQKPDVMHYVLGDAINSQLDTLKLKDTARLTLILTCKAEEIDDRLTVLRVAKLPEDIQSEFGFIEAGEAVDYIGSDGEILFDTGETKDEELINVSEEEKGEEFAGAETSEDQTTQMEIQQPVDTREQAIGQRKENVSQDIIDKQEETIEEQSDTQGQEGTGFRELEIRGIGQGEYGGIPGVTVPTGKDVPPPKPDDERSPAGGQENSSVGKIRTPRNPWTGKGTGKRARGHSSNNRIFTSGVFSNLDQRSDTDDTDSQSIEIGNRAVDRVIEALVQGVKYRRMPHNNPGYDIEIYASDEQTVQAYIEVKGINGSWGVGGVSISAKQYYYAEKYQDKFWLSVVEYALDDNAYRISWIQDPIKQITHYRFDNGWKELAKLETNKVAEPSVGLKVRYKDDQRVGIIVNVEGMGLLKQITIRFEDGREEQVIFKPNLMELIDASEA